MTNPDRRFTRRSALVAVMASLLPAGKLVGPPLPHNDQVLVTALRPDGRALLAGSWSGTASLWSLPAPVDGDVPPQRYGVPR